MDVLVGTAATLRVDFNGPLGTLSADVSSVSWRLFNTAGVQIGNTTSVANAAGVGSVSIEVLATNHTIDAARRFEKRTLVTTWKSGGKSYADRTTYRVIPLLNHSVTADDVRTLLGLNEDELQDTEIDITAAYFRFEEDATQAALETALASGTMSEVRANRGIAADAALAIIPSMPIRTTQTQANGELRSERFRTPPDFSALEATIRNQRSEALTAVASTETIVPSLLVLTSPTDVITG